MSTLTRGNYRGPFAELLDWLESPLTMLRPMSAQTMRVEDYLKGGRYVVRAELPGLDPEKELRPIRDGRPGRQGANAGD